MKFNKYILRTALLVAVLTISVISFEQPPGGPPPGGGGTPPCWTPPCVPIDGGISFLIAAGAFLGIRKLTRRNA